MDLCVFIAHPDGYQRNKIEKEIETIENRINELDELYKICEIARELTLKDEWKVGRIIARPYIGEPGSFKRTANRHDYALDPVADTVLDNLKNENVDLMCCNCPCSSLSRVNRWAKVDGSNNIHFYIFFIAHTYLLKLSAKFLGIQVQSPW